MGTITVNAVIRNELGLHLRPAGVFAETAGRFSCSILVARADDPETAVDAKSMLGLLKLAVTPGTEITIAASGADAREAVDEIVTLIESRFGVT